MSDEEVCSVCWDTFKCPKMLPCKHTFCMSCLCEYLDKFENKSNLTCPLCRETCFVPDEGFGGFPTNYFVSSERIVKQCQECKHTRVSKVCYLCNYFLCTKCDLVHEHITKEAESVDEEENSRLSLSHMRCVVHGNMKTELICEQMSYFNTELASVRLHNERKTIRAMTASYNEGVYVIMADSKDVLKYDKGGNVLERIPLMGTPDAAAILETRSRFLLIAHFSQRSIVCYDDGSPNFKHFHFVKTPAFHPLALSELSNCNIVIGGSTHLCGVMCRTNPCEIEKNGTGVIQIVSGKGQILKEISREFGKYIFKSPSCIASSSTFDTFAVCDTKQASLLVFDNKGNIRNTFSGISQTVLSVLHDFEPFIPVAVCSNLDGNYIVSDPQKGFLYVLSPHGNFIGMLRCEEGETLGNTGTLCTDPDNNIWVGRHTQGKISVLKASRFKNVLVNRPNPPPLLGNGNPISVSNENGRTCITIVGNRTPIRDSGFSMIPRSGNSTSNRGLMGNSNNGSSIRLMGNGNDGLSIGLMGNSDNGSSIGLMGNSNDGLSLGDMMGPLDLMQCLSALTD